MLIFAPWKIWSIVAVLVLGTLLAVPNLLTAEQAERLPSWLPHQRVNLGLDLQGGSHLLLQVGTDQVLKEQLINVADSVRSELRKANIGYSNLGVQGNAVIVKLRDPGQVDAARPLLRQAGGDKDVSISSDGDVRITFNDTALQEQLRRVLAQSIEIIRRRVDETGTREPTIQQQGTDRILVQLPGIQDPERVKGILGKTAKMTFRLVDMNVPLEQAKAGQLPPGDEILPSTEDQRRGLPTEYVVQKRIMVSGENLVDAQASFGQDGLPVVNFKFDSIGGRLFGKATSENVGKLFAIVLDNKVISAPVIRTPILGGSGEISGNFTVQSAQDLALLLRAGALPAPLKIIEERSVGPDLGADSIRAGVYAILCGFVLVAAYMWASYGLFGLFADVAVIFNLILTVAWLSLLQATLTLPGIAGILLMLGMSVDANVLINERIREETRAGRSAVMAIETGYKRAFSTILDSNLTTLIKMLLLYTFGSGTVKGFAVTISLGILTSFFTAMVVVRLMMSIWLRRRGRRVALAV